MLSDTIKAVAHSAVRRFGYEFTRYHGPRYPPDFSPEDISIIRAVRPYTLTSPERVYSLIQALKYICRHKITGSIVECGVWKGGSMMAAALTLLKDQHATRDLYLFDTYQGMTRPTVDDVDLFNSSATAQLGHEAVRCEAGLEEVQQVMLKTGYDPGLLHFIKGDVLETIPGDAPEEIALLRLDTDWYRSTRHELIHLFPRVSGGGVLIVDDYGHWRGSRKAVDEYLADYDPRILLNRIDYTGRIAVKPLGSS